MCDVVLVLCFRTKTTYGFTCAGQGTRQSRHPVWEQRGTSLAFVARARVVYVFKFITSSRVTSYVHEVRRPRAPVVRSRVSSVVRIHKGDTRLSHMTSHTHASHEV